MLGEIETRRLRLRPMTLGDLDWLVELDSDPEVMQYLTGRPSTRAEVEAEMRDRVGTRWIATECDGGVFVGWFGLVPEGDGSYDVGYRLRRDAWGRGLATEGTGALIDAAFRHMQARRVIAQTMAVNRRSRAVMERCGMSHVRTFHLAWDDPLPGTEEGEVEYELTRRDWNELLRQAEEQ